MKKTRIMYSRLTALAIVVMFATQGLMPALAATTVTKGSQEGGILTQDLASISPENSTLQSFTADLIAFEAHALALKQAATKRPDEVKKLRDEAAALKRRVAGVRAAADGVLRKLKALGRDNGEFDSGIVSELSKVSTSSSLISFLRQNGGARGLFRTLSTQATRLTDEIDAAVIEIDTTSNISARSLRHTLRCILLGAEVVGGLITGCRRCREDAEKEFDNSKCNDR